MRNKILHYIILTLSLILISATFLLSNEQHDIIFDVSIVYDIKKRYKLFSSSKYNLKFMSERSTKKDEIKIPESYFAPISDISATINEEPISDYFISYEYIQSEDSFIGNTKYNTIRFPNDLDKGDILTYSFKNQYASLVFLPIHYIPNLDYVNSYKIVLNHPKDLYIDFNIEFTKNNINYTIDRGKKRRTIIKFGRIPQYRKLEGFPFNNFHASVLIKILNGKNNLNGITPSDFTKWYNKKLSAIQALDHSLIGKLNNEIKKQLTDYNKLKLIYDYVRTNIRYIAEHKKYHSIIPHAPSQVLKKKYGDCKDRAFLVKAIANMHGIPVDLALISTEPKIYHYGLNHVSLYNHMICYYKHKGKTILFDPTDKYGSFNTLRESCIESKILVLNKTKPRLIRIKNSKVSDFISINITADLDKPDMAKAIITLKSDYYKLVCMAKDNLTGVDLENFLTLLINSIFYKISFDYFKFKSLSDDEIQFTAEADISKFIISSKSKKYIPITPFRTIHNNILDRKNDNLPIYFDTRANYSLTINLNSNKYKSPNKRYRLGSDKIISMYSSIKNMNSGFCFKYNFKRVKKIINKQRELFLEFSEDYIKGKTKMFILKRI